MSDVSVSDASIETLLSELEKRGIVSIARKLSTYEPSEKEKVIANGVAYSMNNPRELLADLLAYQYAYERISLEVQDTYVKDEEQWEEFFKGEGTI